MTHYMNPEQQIIEHIKNAPNILLVPHINPDGDAISCVSCFLHLAKQFDERKNVHIFSQDKIPSQLNFLDLSQTQIFTNPHDLSLPLYNLIIACDCGDIGRTGLEQELFLRRAPLINIDHHKNNDFFADINIVEENAGATAEIVFKLFQQNNIPISKYIADLLAIGILTDTDNLSTLTTTSQTLDIIAQLIEFGADIKSLNQKLWHNQNTTTLKYWGEILDLIKINRDMEIATIIIPAHLQMQIDALSTEILGEITNFFNDLQEVKMVLILKEDPDGKIIKGSLRTTQNNVDVSLLASILGGGGHPKAAGFSFPGQLLLENNKWVVT